MKKIMFMLPVLILVPLFLIGGCSKKSTTATNNDITNLAGIQLADYRTLVEQIAPPEYVVSLMKPAVVDSASIDTFWYWGNYPLLGKVFGENEPMSLYCNMNTLESMAEMINAILDSITAYGTDTGSIIGPDQLQHEVIVSVESLTTPVAIPAECQAVMGTEFDLENHLSITVADMNNFAIDLGFTVNDAEETIVSYQLGNPMSQGSDTVESCLFYAHRDKATDAIEIKEVFFKDYGNGTKAIWVFQIKTVNENDFSYRMSWYADDFGDTSGLACVIGGGNKDDQFALRYNQYRPADRGDIDPDDPYSDLSRFFGLNYANLGDSIPEAFVAITNPDSMYLYDDLPMELLNNPLEAPGMINPWHNH